MQIQALTSFTAGPTPPTRASGEPLDKVSLREGIEHDEDTDTSRYKQARELIRARPEVLTPEFFRDEVVGLARQSPWLGSLMARELVGELLRAHPEWVPLIPAVVMAPKPDPVQTVILAEEEPAPPVLDSRDRELIELAHEHGWRPSTPSERDWMARWLHTPTGSDPTFRGILQLVSSNPEEYAPCQVHGQPLPVVLWEGASQLPDREQLAEEAIGTKIRVRPVQAWHQQLIKMVRQADPERILAHCEKAYQGAGSLGRLSGEEQVKLALASTLPGSDDRLARLLQGERNECQSLLGALVDRLVREPRRAAILEEMTPANAVDLGRESLEMTLATTQDEPIIAVQERMLAVLKDAPPESRRAQGAQLLAALEPALARYKSAEDVPREEIVKLALLTPFLCLDPELRKKSEPIMIAFSHVEAGNGWNPAWLNVGHQLSKRVMGAIQAELSGLSSYDQRLRIHEAMNLAFLLGKNREQNVSAPLTEWIETCREPSGNSREHWGSNRVAWMETGLAALQQKGLRFEWAQQAADLKNSRRFEPVAQFAGRLARKMMPDVLQGLQTPGQSAWDRSRLLLTARNLVEVTLEGNRSVTEAFLTHATEQEKAVLAELPDPIDSAHVLFLLARRPKATWPMLQPLVGGGVQPLSEVLNSVWDREQLEPELAQYGALLRGLGPGEGRKAASIFREVKELEASGVPSAEAFSRIVKQHLKLDAVPGAGLKESSQDITLGGVKLRKRARS